MRPQVPAPSHVRRAPVADWHFVQLLPQLSSQVELSTTQTPTLSHQWYPVAQVTVQLPLVHAGVP
jgi:hypothetical protein